MLENVNRSLVALPGGAPSGPSTTSPSGASAEATDKNKPVSSATTRSRVAWSTILAAAVVALAVWMPRAFQLDHFVTIDEGKWLVRSANYYQALTYGNLIDTFQHGHPGVMIMYAGLAGYLWQFPEYVSHVSTQYQWDEEFMFMISNLGHQPIDMLAAGRTFIVLFNVIALTMSFLYARRLVGLWPALVAFLLIAFDPFHIALSRFLHPDSLLSTFMLLATLAFMAYLFAGRRMWDLVAAGICTAIAVLTKTPAIFLIPLVGLLTLIELAAHVTSQRGWRWQEFFSGAALWRIFRTWLIWGSVTVVVYLALWPAMWVAPIWTLTQVLDISGDYATQGHSSPVFFNGQIYNGDPGFWFYPINYLWRTTPLVMIGLVLLVAAFFWRGSLVRQRSIVLTVLGLFASALFFNIFMTLGAKKFDRYLLPVFMPLDFVAAMGWAALIAGLASWRKVPWGRYAATGVAVGAIGLQAGLALNTFPYYMSYYNPVMGGPTKAENVMFIGWGEGLDEAGRYLNKTVDTTTTTVASWYERGPFSFFYEGSSSSNRYIWDNDYSVVYNHQWQRELPNRRMMAYFDTLEPVHTINLNSIDYVKIYDMHEVPAADYNVSWGNAIDLMYYDTFSGIMYPGQHYAMTMHFVKSAPLEIDYNLKVRIVNQEGHTLLLKEGQPDALPTSKWEIGTVLRDDAYQLDIPEGTPPGLYRIELSFYDPATFDHLPAVQVNSGQLLGDPYVLDYLIVGEWSPKARVKVSPPVLLGDLVQLEGAAMLNEAGEEEPLAGKSFAPNEAINLRLHWQTKNFIHENYTTFVHVVGPDGTLVTQADRQPMDGFIPTSYWPPRQIIVDDYTIQLPADAPTGEYKLLLGWYDLETVTRLPMSQKGNSIGDSYQVATFTVR